MEKLTFKQLLEKINEHNKKNQIKTQYSDSNPLICIAVIDNSSFTEEYPLESRSYKFRSDEKFFLPHMISNSIWAESLDKTDYIRLDYYLNHWKIEYFYIIEVQQ